MDATKAVKTMRLRYDGVCAGCDTTLTAGTRAHCLPPAKTVRCLDCGPTDAPPIEAAQPTTPPAPEIRAEPSVGARLPTPTFATQAVHRNPGVGARREHERRLERHRTKVGTGHPRLGGLILTLSDDSQHVRAWQTSTAGEEEFGRRLSGCSGPDLKVFHDRKLPRTSGNIDHLAVTAEKV